MAGVGLVSLHYVSKSEAMSYGVTVTNGRGHPAQGSTQDASKLFKQSLNSLFTDEQLVHDRANVKVSMKLWLFELALNKPELVMRALEAQSERAEKLGHAQLDKIRTETDLLEKKHNEESVIRGLTAQKLRKEIDGGLVVEIDTGIADDHIKQLLSLAKDRAYKNKKKK